MSATSSASWCSGGSRTPGIGRSPSRVVPPGWSAIRAAGRRSATCSTRTHSPATLPRSRNRSVASSTLSEGRGELVDNRDWTAPITLLEFLRDVGKHVTVNQMIARDSVKNRLASEHGISYTEFSYMLLQANDYLWLHDHHGCHLQVGGADQWGNLVSGVDLIRRARGVQVHALAWPLLLAPDGSKLGKTTGARTWLDAGKTSPYQLHQHFVNLSDAEVAQQLRMLSLRPLTDVEALLADTRHRTREAASRSARSPTRSPSSCTAPTAAAAAREAADVLFGGDPLTASEAAIRAIAGEVPTTRLNSEQLADPVELLVTTGLASSKSEARRLFDQRGIRANGVQLDANSLLSDLDRAPRAVRAAPKGQVDVPRR